jgi:ABC-type bacteriocin/lantibiotic exporter with double-glycine peptidase domain
LPVRTVLALLVAALLALLPGVGQATGARQLAVPYRTQLDGNPYQHADCGPASLAMAMAAYGTVVPTRQLRARVNDAQGSWGDYDAGADISVLASIAAWYGLTPEGLGGAGAPRRWTLDDVRARLDAGQPVVAELRYRALPGHGGSSYEGDHYVVLTGYDGDAFVYNDPVDPTGRGMPLRISGAQLDRAWRGDRAYAAFAVVGPAGGLPDGGD